MSCPFTCGLCFDPFEVVKNELQMLWRSHSIWFACVTKDLGKSQGQDLLPCPLDANCKRSILKSFVPNIALIAILKMRSHPDFCCVHEKTKILFCVADQCRICFYCAKYGDHKSHQVEAREEEGVCSIHWKKKKYFCLTDSKYLCGECIHFTDQHKQHSFKRIRELTDEEKLSASSGSG